MTPDDLPLRALMIVASGSEREGMSVRDGRVERYAELLLDTCLGVERGWQVMVWSTPWARPLLEEVMKQLAERGAYPLLRLTFGGGHWREHRAWLRHAPLEVISEPAMIEVHARHQCDAWLGVQAPENTRDGADIPAERTSALDEGVREGVSRRQVTPRLRGHSRGDVLVSDAGAGPGRRNDVACVRRLPLRLVPDRLEEHVRAHLASCATARRGGGSPDRRRRNGFAAVRGR